MSNTNTNATDPSGFVSNPPSTIVKVVNTARDDMNGQLGIVTAYNQGRGRYIVHMTATQSTTALKPENLTRGTMMDKVKANYQQIRNDPNLKRQLQQVYSVMDSKIPDPYKPEHVAIGVLLFVIGCVYFIGLTKMISLITLLMLLGIIVAPDLMAAAQSQQPPSLQTMASNFPRRCRETIEQSFPSLAGKVTDNIALGVVLLAIFMVGKGIVSNPAKQARRTMEAANAAAGTSSSSSARMMKQSSDILEQAYKVGFEDGTSGKEFGTSLAQVIANHQDANNDILPPMASSTNSLDFDEGFENYLSSQSRTPKKASFGFGTAMSAFFCNSYRMGIRS
mmetsp:Transcript_7629/g.10866  ORF Transcript_7629/g.10866 Transcript_7629/m.10866 type:complete len:336 (-) Transcript_7629:253-1260(-)